MKAKPLADGRALVRRRGMESERKEQAMPESVLHPIAMATVDSKESGAEPESARVRAHP